MSLATAGIDCTVSPPLLGAMEDCSIVRGPQPQAVSRTQKNTQKFMWLWLWTDDLKF